MSTLTYNQVNTLKIQFNVLIQNKWHKIGWKQKRFTNSWKFTFCRTMCTISIHVNIPPPPIQILLILHGYKRAQVQSRLDYLEDPFDSWLALTSDFVFSEIYACPTYIFLGRWHLQLYCFPCRLSKYRHQCLNMWNYFLTLFKSLSLFLKICYMK